MQNYSSRLIVIKNKINELVEENTLLNKEKIELNSSNLALHKQIEEQSAQLSELNEKIQVLKLAKSISGDEKPQEKTDLKRKINDYIKEIDRCIALLNE